MLLCYLFGSYIKPIKLLVMCHPVLLSFAVKLDRGIEEFLHFPIAFKICLTILPHFTLFPTKLLSINLHEAEIG